MQDLARSALAADRATMVSTHDDSASTDASSCCDVVAQRPRDHLGGVTRLHVEEIREVHGEPGLRDGQDEAVRETVDGEAVKSPHTVSPLVGERHRVSPDDLEAGSPRVLGADLETGCEDQTVDAVLDAVDDHTVAGDPPDALALRVDEGDVVAVERLQILVVEARSLTEVAVPGFERFGSGGIGDNRIDAGPDVLHLREVGHFHCAQTLFVGHPFDSGLPHHEELLDDARPRIVDEVLIGLAACGEQLEVLDAVTLPSVLQRLRPCRIGRSVATHIDGRRGALKDEQLLDCFGDVRDALDGGGTGSDDPDPLVRQPRQI